MSTKAKMNIRHVNEAGSSLQNPIDFSPGSRYNPIYIEESSSRTEESQGFAARRESDQAWGDKRSGQVCATGRFATFSIVQSGTMLAHASSTAAPYEMCPRMLL